MEMKQTNMQRRGKSKVDAFSIWWQLDRKEKLWMKIPPWFSN